MTKLFYGQINEAYHSSEKSLEWKKDLATSPDLICQECKFKSPSHPMNGRPPRKKKKGSSLFPNYQLKLIRGKNSANNLRDGSRREHLSAITIRLVASPRWQLIRHANYSLRFAASGPRSNLLDRKAQPKNADFDFLNSAKKKIRDESIDACI